MKKAFVEYIRSTPCKRKGRKEWMLYELAEKRKRQGKVEILKVEKA